MLRRGCGRLKVAHELTRRGLTDTVIDRAIAGVLEGRSEAALVRAALDTALRAASRRRRGRTSARSSGSWSAADIPQTS